MIKEIIFISQDPKGDVISSLTPNTLTRDEVLEALSRLLSVATIPSIATAINLTVDDAGKLEELKGLLFLGLEYPL